MSEIDFNALGQCIDSTFGRSSTKSSASQSVKVVLQSAEKVEVRYTAIVNLVSDRELVDLRKRYTDEATSVIDDTLKRIKGDYKEATEKGIKFSQVSETDSFEIINMNIYNGKRTAYYRRNIVFSIS